MDSLYGGLFSVGLKKFGYGRFCEATNEDVGVGIVIIKQRGFAIGGCVGDLWAAKDDPSWEATFFEVFRQVLRMRLV